MIKCNYERQELVTDSIDEIDCIKQKLIEYKDTFGNKDKAIWAGLPEAGFIMYKKEVPTRIIEHLEFLQISIKEVDRIVKELDSLHGCKNIGRVTLCFGGKRND